jgi:uncharacterized protein (DUF1778 family)
LRHSRTRRAWTEKEGCSTKNQQENKSASLKLRLSQEELQQITETAELLGMSRSEYVRQQALTGQIAKPVIRLSYDSEQLHRTNAELNKIGSNLNQIAHHLNVKNPAQSEVLARIEKIIDILMEETEQIQALLA